LLDPQRLLSWREWQEAMSNETDLETILPSLGDEELIAAVETRAGGAGGAAALKELVRRDSPRAGPVLAAVMLDTRSCSDMRAAAAIALGRKARPEHRRALVEALKADPPNVLRRAAEALGRIGTREALPALGAVPVPADPAARRALAFARSLLAYRLGLRGERLRPPGDSGALPVGEGATRLRPVRVGKKEGERVAADLERELPAIPVSLEGGVQLACAGDLLMVLPHARVPSVPTSAFVAAVVLKRSPALGRFTLHLYLLSHPSGAAKLALFGVRPDGTMTHIGSMRASGEALDFRLEALDTPYSPPVAIEGRLIPAGPRLELSKVLVGSAPAGKNRARTPRRAA
jgi:hypothetical protein